MIHSYFLDISYHMMALFSLFFIVVGVGGGGGGEVALRAIACICRRPPSRPWCTHTASRTPFEPRSLRLGEES